MVYMYCSQATNSALIKPYRVKVTCLSIISLCRLVFTYSSRENPQLHIVGLSIALVDFLRKPLAFIVLPKVLVGLLILF